MRLVLVRHGETTANVRGCLDTGRPGASLTARGRAQARALAERWPDLAGDAPTIVAVSPLARTRQTAGPLLARYGVSPLIRPGAREILAGDLEMNGDRPSGIRYGQVVSAWACGGFDVRMPGGETGAHVLARALAVVDEVLRRAGQRAGGDGIGVIVAHGSVLRTLAPFLAADLPGRLAAAHPLDNAHTAVLETDGPLPDGRAAAGAAGSTRASAWSWEGRFHALTWDERPPSQWSSRG